MRVFFHIPTVLFILILFRGVSRYQGDVHHTVIAINITFLK